MARRQQTDARRPTGADGPPDAPAGAPPLRRDDLLRVVESLLRAELTGLRGRARPGAPSGLPPAPWPETLRLGEDGLGCDSIERLWLAAAVNEMFGLDASAPEDGAAGGDLPARPTLGAWVDAVGEALARPGARITFATSGSTGTPKRCVHRLDDLAFEVEGLAALFAGRTRIVALAPAHHIYGFLFTALLPARLGVKVLEAEPLGIGALARTLGTGDLIVSFPERWRYLERSLEAFPAGIVGATSTAPCPRGLIEALAARALDGMVEIYGSSETAGIGTRAWPETAYTLMPGWTADDPPEGVAAPAHLVHRSGREAVTMDRLAFDRDGRFTVEGRADDAVQVGGVNVFPGRVAARLRDHPLVRDAAVRLMRPEEGTRLKAFVVPAGDAPGPEIEAALRRWIDAELPAPERPKAIAFGPALPVGPSGKPRDW